MGWLGCPMADGEFEPFICGFCKKSLDPDAADEVAVRMAETGELAMLSCPHCGAVLGFVPIRRD
jgi:hypothetical protein